MKEIIWDSEKNTPYAGDMSDFHDWANVLEVRLGYADDTFEWVRFRRLENGYKILHSKSSRGSMEICPEDIWGIRLK